MLNWGLWSAKFMEGVQQDSAPGPHRKQGTTHLRAIVKQLGAITPLKQERLPNSNISELFAQCVDLVSATSLTLPLLAPTPPSYSTHLLS